MKKRIAAALCLALALCLLASCGKGQLRVEVWRRRVGSSGDAKIVGWQLEGTELRLEVSPEWAELEGFERSLADCCAVLTFCALDGVDSVTIYSLGQRLAGPLDESGIFLGE